MTGGIALQWTFRGLSNLQALYIRNTGTIDIPISFDDFKAHTYQKPNEWVPALASPPYAYSANKPDTPLPTSIQPGQQTSFSTANIFTEVVWIVGGKYGTIIVQGQEGALSPTATPNPGC